MAKLNFGGVEENVVTRDEFPTEKAQEILKDEVVAIIGYGVQGPGQALNLRDNNIKVIIGQRKGSKTWDKALADGWVEGETLFDIEEACEKGTIIQVGSHQVVSITGEDIWRHMKFMLSGRVFRRPNDPVNG